MARGTLSLSRKEKSVSILDLNNAVAPVKVVSKRGNCHTLEGAMGYFKERVSEMSGDTEDATWEWVQEDKAQGYWYVRIMLHSMPVYWKMEKSGKTVDILDPEGAVIERREQMIGFDRYKVDSFQAGKDLLTALASSDDATFSSIMATAAEALQRVDNQELPHIRAKAEILYNNSEWKDKMGQWDKKDATGSRGTPTYSKDKTNKMNQYKQTARRQLGYERAKVTVEVS